jgi:outer membrane protein
VVTKLKFAAHTLFILLALNVSSAFALDVKVGVVNITELLEKSPQAVDAQNRLKKEFEARDKQLIEEQKELKKKEDKLERDSDVMTDTARTKLERDIRNLRRDIRRMFEEVREDKTIRTNQELSKLQNLISQAVKEVGKGAGYDIILYEGSIIFASKKVDITDTVMERLQESQKK